MADNVTANPGAAGATFRTDDVGAGIQIPYTKLNFGGDGVDSPVVAGQATMANSLPVALASNQSALPVTDNSGSLTVDSTQLPAALGQNTMANSFAVAIASNQSSLTVAGSGGAGSDAAALRVSLSNADAVTQGSTAATNPIQNGVEGRTTDPTAVTDGQNNRAISTVLGKQITKPYAIPASEWFYAAAAGGLVTTAGVTVKAAGAANVRNYVTAIQVINSHATISTEIVIRDGASGTVIFRGWAQAAGGGFACNFADPLRGSAATLLEIAEVTATGTTGVLVNVQGYSGIE